MQRVTIIVSKHKLNNLLSHAGQKQLLHLLSVPDEGLPEGAEPFEANQILSKAAAIRSRLSSLSNIVPPNSAPASTEAPIQDLDSLADSIGTETAEFEQSLRHLDESIQKLDADRGKNTELARFLSGLEAFGITLDTFARGDFVTVLPGEASEHSISSIQAELSKITYGNLIFGVAHPTGDAQTFLAVFPKVFREDVSQSVASLGGRVGLEWAGLSSDFSEARKQIDLRIEKNREERKTLEEERDMLIQKIGPRYWSLVYLSEVLDIRAKALASSLATESTCVLQAWIPKDQIQDFSEGASYACQGMITIHEEETKEHGEDRPPTLVRVPEWTKPLQSVVNNFGVPSYRELNPLPIMIISYPLIYGLMFGDFGQGPLFILLGLFLRRLKKKGVRVSETIQIFVNGAELFILLGIGTTIFGFIFGDFFGFEPDFLLLREEDGHRVPLFSPSHHILTFMGITLLIGVGHYTLGLALSVYTKLLHKERSHAFFGPICWVWFYLTGVIIVAIWVLAGFDFSAVSRIPWIFLSLTVPMILMAWKEGPLHWFEAFLSAASNTFSYLRIWALNVAGFYLKIALFAVGGIPGAIGGNLLVMIIEGMIVFVQTLRLHWVEWFSKFYEGNGEPFAPYREPSGLIVSSHG